MKTTCAIIFFFLELHLTALSALAAGEGADPEKRILGHWQGIGMAVLIEMVFESNHTFYYVDEPANHGTWSYQNGQYTLKGKEVTFQARLDAEGRLILIDPEDPKLETPLRKKDEIKPPALNTSQAAPEGEWRFAYIRKSSISAGPPFDAITFTKGKALLKFTPADQQFMVDCPILNNTIALPTTAVSPTTAALPTTAPQMLKTLMNYMPLGRPLPAVVQLAYRWEDGGQTLILSNSQAAQPFGCEWAFLRKEQSPPATFIGTWVGKGSQTGNVMELRQDGTLNFALPGDPRSHTGAKPQLPIKYYRLWKSSFGDAISIAQLSPDMQLVHVQMARYEIQGKDIILTPIECQYGEKLQLAAGKTNWKLLTAGDKGGAEAAMTPDRQTTVTLTALDLAGDWSGSAEGTEISYTFNPDGTMVWRVNDPQFKASAPDGAKGRFRIIKGLRFNEIKLYRFESPELEDHSFRGIIELLDENSFKMEIGQGANSIEFSVEAVIFRRKGPKPKFDDKQLATIAQANADPKNPPYKVEALPREVITLPGGVKLEMIRIPAGSFLMGLADATDKDSWSKPAHPVTIKNNFSLGRTEVTQEQWTAVMGKWPPATDEKDPAGRRLAASGGIGKSFPAYDVSWDDCQHFIMALNEYITKSGQGAANFRLPSEAEWEYACRAGTQTRFYWGDDPSCLQIDHYAWYGDNSAASGMEYAVHEVGLKLPNPWGLYDLSGNVSEWCQDSNHYSYKGASRPDDGSPWMDAKSQEHVLRGGANDNLAKGCQSAFRAGSIDHRNGSFGFRLARGGSAVK